MRKFSSIAIFIAILFASTLAFAQPVTVTNVSSPTPNGLYGIGAVINVEVTFSDVVDVTGTPLLYLNNSGRAASYNSGSGTATLTFTYTIAEGETAADLDYVATNSLDPNGGTIQNGGVDADLTLPSPGGVGSLGLNNDIEVDGIRPNTNITVNPDLTTYSTSATFEFESNETGTFQRNLDGGDWVAVTSPENLTSLTDGSHTYQVRAIDQAGNPDDTPARYTWTILPLPWTPQTPTKYEVSIYKVEFSQDSLSYVTVIDNGATPVTVDIVQGGNFGMGYSVPAGTYSIMRVTMVPTIIYSGDNPVGGDPIVDGEFTIPEVSNPVIFYWATWEFGGDPANAQGPGGGLTLGNAFFITMPITIPEGVTTELNLIFNVTGTIHWDAFMGIYLTPPIINSAYSNPALNVTATYNIIYYSAGGSIDSGGLHYESGWGVATFNPDGTWSAGVNFNANEVDGSGHMYTTASQTIEGLYGINSDGSIYMTIVGEWGIIRGAISSDGNIFCGVRIDNTENKVLIYGVKQSTSPSVVGDYFFQNYGDAYWEKSWTGFGIPFECWGYYI